jgi:hypothetical protein
MRKQGEEGGHPPAKGKAQMNCRPVSGFPKMSEAFATRSNLNLAVDRYRRDLTTAWIEQYANVVLTGPFAGLQLEQLASWGDGDILAKLLGTYEAELHSIIYSVINASPSTVINIGCAEGFYAIGLAQAIPKAKVVAFDCDKHARELCARLAALNSVGDRVTIQGRCTVPRLRTVLAKSERTFLLVDCEGGELDLIYPSEVPELAQTDMLIECHDFVYPSLTHMLERRLRSTHKICRVDEQNTRDLDDFPALKILSSIDRAIATCEWRPARMNWLYCQALMESSNS